jgi:hypothetical protein
MVSVIAQFDKHSKRTSTQTMLSRVIFAVRMYLVCALQARFISITNRQGLRSAPIHRYKLTYPLSNDDEESRTEFTPGGRKRFRAVAGVEQENLLLPHGAGLRGPTDEHYCQL